MCQRRIQGPEGFPLADTTDEVLHSVVETNLVGTNLVGTLFVLREAARRVRSGGRVVTMSSTATVVKLPTSGPYAASTSAIETLTTVLAKELGHRAVTVNCIAPGPTDTDLFTVGKTTERIAAVAGTIPRGRIGRPEEIADVVGFLAGSDAAWVSGQVIGANGGMA
jgi:3-oxoacyl-[acyl-carrier protein] reductase